MVEIKCPLSCKDRFFLQATGDKELELKVIALF